MLENRNADKYTKAYEIILKAPKRTQTFYDVLIGEANRANACKNWEKLLGTKIHWTKCLPKSQKLRKLN